MYRKVSEQLAEWLTKPNRKPLIVKGARQVGKTYSLKAFGQQHFARTHYINFERNVVARELFKADLDPKRILKDLSFLLDTEIDTKKDLLLFDEVQLAANGITSLKYFREELPELALCAAGSLIGLNLGEDSVPVGNADILNLYPLSFSEFLDACGLKHQSECLRTANWGQPITEVMHIKLFESLKNYFVCGGMPAVVNAFVGQQDNPYKASKLVREEQLNLVELYINDFAKHCGKTNALHLERVFRAISTQLARTVDSKALRFQFKDVVPGIAQYAPLSSAFDWLNAAGLMLRVPVLSEPIPPLISRVKESIFRVYLHDVGLLGAMADIKPENILSFNFSNFKGYFAENFVAQELVAQSGGPLFSWKHNTSEIEFLIDRGDYALPIEVKAGNFKLAKSLQVYIERYHPPQALILTGLLCRENPIRKARVLPMYLAGKIPELVAAHQF